MDRSTGNSDLLDMAFTSPNLAKDDLQFQIGNDLATGNSDLLDMAFTSPNLA